MKGQSALRFWKPAMLDQVFCYISTRCCCRCQQFIKKHYIVAIKFRNFLIPVLSDLLDSGPKVFTQPCDAIPVDPHENDDHQGEKNHSNLPILSKQLGKDFNEYRTDDRSGKRP